MRRTVERPTDTKIHELIPIAPAAAVEVQGGIDLGALAQIRGHCVFAGDDTAVLPTHLEAAPSVRLGGLRIDGAVYGT